MFHRVKSEVQENEHDSQGKQPTYRHEDNTHTATARQENGASDAPASRSYSPVSEKTQSEETPVRGKYAMEKEERVSEQETTSYKPSVPRPSYGGGSSSYGGGSSSSSYTAPEAPAYPSGGSDRTLTIGRGINMSGEIDACDHLLVEGTVEAALKGAKVLDIAESGTFYGTVEIEEATIAGRFEGDITVNGRLTLKASGVITGSIAYRELEVEAGAMLDGRMTPMKGNVDPKAAENYRKGTEASAMAKAKEIVGKKDDREPANTERGLFSKAHASY
ncbi:MAG: bactofilin family protein [Alphaproteobacteria bacterium]